MPPTPVLLSNLPTERRLGRLATLAGASRALAARLAAPPQPRGSDRGSQTMEYALILIVAATIAMLALTWARQGAIKALLDAVMHKVMALFEIGKG